ncbi:Fe2+-dependent dioxygenase [Chitinophagaceae bacterium MMS25-I14]
MKTPSSIIHIKSLLDANELSAADKVLPHIIFENGKATASGAAREVKNNLQAIKNDNQYTLQLQQIVFGAVARNPLIQAAFMPKFILPPIISKYQPGMQYGWHTDSPLMSHQHMTIRADLSMTVFLSDPDTYTGGELEIQSATGNTSYKLDKGDAIIYPTTKLHCVNPVTEGERVAAVTWMQSVIGDADKRELLFQLKSVQETVGLQQELKSENLVLQQAYSNLVRMWAEI